MLSVVIRLTLGGTWKLFSWVNYQTRMLRNSIIWEWFNSEQEKTWSGPSVKKLVRFIRVFTLCYWTVQFKERPVNCILTHFHWGKYFKQTDAQVVKKFHEFYIPRGFEGSLPCLQKPATRSYPEPVESSPHYHTRLTLVICLYNKQVLVGGLVGWWSFDVKWFWALRDNIY
jgi:hypothetical protein